MGKDIEVYRQLRGDAHTGGCIRRRKAAVKALEWRIERGKASARITRIVQEVFDRLDLDTLINEIMDAVLYGYAPLEVIWGHASGRASLPDQIVGKPPEWFLFGTDALIRFRSRDNPLHGDPHIPRKYLVAQQEATYANPYGFADLSMCFWPVTFKRGGLRYWVKFAEKYGMPWAVGKQPRNTPQPETQRLLDQLEAMIEDAVAVIPDDASVEMVRAEGVQNDAGAYELLLKYCRSEVAIALLGQNQSTESDSTRASATAGLDVARDLRDGDAGMVESVLNKQLIRWIVDLHEGDAAPAPTFEMWEQEEVSKAQAERDEILTRAGVKFTQQYFQRVYALQDGDIDAAPASGAQFAEAQAQDTDPLAQMIDEASADWRPVLDPLLAPIWAALDQAMRNGDTAQQFIDRLPALLTQMDAQPLHAGLDALTVAARSGGMVSGLEEM